ncbi:hypothetical protein HDU98_003610 [Podochytrium sp. JEL0797]|nr:hypothetical protein HDU98_003610 [Podochytrium sp. JEL0797]
MFQKCLKALGIFNGETLYGFRVGNAISTAIEDEETNARVMAAGGWRTLASAKHYGQFAIAAAHVGEGLDPIEAVHDWLINKVEYAYF